MTTWNPTPPKLFTCRYCGATLPESRMFRNEKGARCRDHIVCMMRTKEQRGEV